MNVRNRRSENAGNHEIGRCEKGWNSDRKLGRKSFIARYPRHFHDLLIDITSTEKRVALRLRKSASRASASISTFFHIDSQNSRFRVNSEFARFCETIASRPLVCVPVFNVLDIEPGRHLFSIFCIF